VKQLFEPQFVDLMDHDKQQFVVFRAVWAAAFRCLNAQQFVQP
jgi:hypothetical protein